MTFSVEVDRTHTVSFDCHVPNFGILENKDLRLRFRGRRCYVRRLKTKPVAAKYLRDCVKLNSLCGDSR